MATERAPDSRDIPELLRSARLLRGEMRLPARELSLHFSCLRRNTDGTALADATVELHLAHVVAVAAVYDATWPQKRPSEFNLPSECEMTVLNPWPMVAQEVALRVDSKADDEQVALAARVRWIMGGAQDASRAAKRVSFNFAVECRDVDAMLWIACGEIAPWSAGRSLDLQLWVEQYRAWWHAWAEKTTTNKRTARDSDRASGEGKVVPFVQAEGSTDRGSPPSELPFALETSVVPSELLEPLRVWFEAPFAGEWLKMARVYPDLDSTDEARAQALAHSSADYEPWSFAREATNAWIEGTRAHVQVLGVHYFPPDEGSSAYNRLTRWSFDLRKRGNAWQIRRYVEDDGSDDAMGADWIKCWSAGPIHIGPPNEGS
jgi:hypothetical protein